MSEHTGSPFHQLIEIMATLLGPNGCPWDREQSLASLRPYLIEECFEVVDAMDSDDVDNHKEELGDLLLQIVFQSALRARDDQFDIDAVINGLIHKLVSRHPHVFADTSVDNADEVVSRWEELKIAEKRAKGTPQQRLLDNVPKSMPALSQAQKISAKVAKVGFAWPDAEGCLQKIREEIQEVADAVAHSPPERIREEIGDLLLATVGLANQLQIDADAALAAANRKFRDRFAKIEDRLAETGRTPKQSTLAEMDTIWTEIKCQSR